jgi:hypothetical protein
MTKDGKPFAFTTSRRDRIRRVWENGKRSIVLGGRKFTLTLSSDNNHIIVRPKEGTPLLNMETPAFQRKREAARREAMHKHQLEKAAKEKK